MSFAIDIGKFSIKLVELEKVNDTIKIVKLDSINIVDDLDTYNIDKLSKSQISASIQDLSSKLEIKTKKIKNLISSLPGNYVDTRQVSILDMPDNELLQALELEAKKHVPLDGTEAIIDYHHIGKDSHELDKINLLLTTTTKNHIKDHAEILKNSGFKPGIFDTDSIALCNLLQFSYDLPDTGANVILDIGHSSTSLIVYGNNTSYFCREIEIAGNQISKSLIRDHNIKYSEAEHKKYKDGVSVFESDEGNTEQTISVEKRTVLNDLVDEIRKTLRFYMKNNSQAFFNQFYLSGGCSKMIGLDNFIADSLNVKVEVINPLSKIEYDKTLDNPGEFSIAIGLALRGLF
tara:strand:- start:215 stop:1255 length:1041 start_codon:yes stop_codon:yes gene_type:complete